MYVSHGDIKINNVRFNTASGNYILLDFGLAMMSDEERRSNIGRLGAIEFMAPEQNTGQMLFQTDVYSFGIVLFELLSGTVPFPIKDNGETARNEVRLAHMVASVPNLLELRKSALPSTWTAEKKEREMQVPDWVIKMIEKCLEKKPEKRFSNGGELYNYIIRQLTSSRVNARNPVSSISIKPLAKQDFIVYHQQLKKQLSLYQNELTKKENELAELKELLGEEQMNGLRVEKKKVGASKSSRVSSASFIALLFLTVGLGAFVMYPVIKNSPLANAATAGNAKGGIKTSTKKHDAFEPAFNTSKKQVAEQDESAALSNEADSTSGNPGNNLDDQRESNEISVADGLNQPTATANDAAHSANRTFQAGDPAEPDSNSASGKVLKKYAIAAKAYFYDQPNEQTRRDEFISPQEKPVVLALHERYGFIYVVITTPEGQVFKGWLRKRDVKLYSDD
jgi:serine/threonine protein kinase